MSLRTTPDAYIGLDAPSSDAWNAWHSAMLREREAIDVAYDPATDWSDATFRQMFLFMYDAAFYDRDRGYRTRELVERWRAQFGRVDSVLLWQGYPRLGFDTRDQFDFYRDMPGGIAKLRTDVVDVFHRCGLRVFVDYNPWAPGTYDELGDIVAGVDADGVMLDTLPSAPESLERAVLQRKSGVVFAPELRPEAAQLGRYRQAWAQWSDIGDAHTPSILRHAWLLPRHRQFMIRRWDETRKLDIVYSFFNGTGLLLWDNVFGAWNPYGREDRRLIAETGALLDHYAALFVHGDWLPLIPTGVSGLDANRWDLGARAIITLRNRTQEPLAYRLPEADGAAYFAFWGDRHELRGGDTVTVAPNGIQAVVRDGAMDARRALEHFERLGRNADVELEGYDERRPYPRPLRPPAVSRPRQMANLIEIPGGEFQMRIRHERRECGCYAVGATEHGSLPSGDNALWGWFYKDILEHVIPCSVTRFAIRATAVTNAEFLAFVHAARYRPGDDEHFLKHLRDRGVLPATVAGDRANEPVTFVSLDDARAFAAWHGQRLPTEAEWQWTAEGAGAGHRYPWGNEPRSFPSVLQPAATPETATPQGIMGLSGNAWEFTESEYSDGHTRFVMLRGGVFLPPAETEWIVARGPRPNDYHAKYILRSDGLDRSETISFRTVAELT
ncbi:formylglycine-generating enzyme family protein [Pendulispora brunnea]|uniref:Formylglycine-generating enzyme family protein n=1 Tax=Pendulispora brunnea TaxID=2905690 RepID=A0ABZ2JVE8_9BACT